MRARDAARAMLALLALAGAARADAPIVRATPARIVLGTDARAALEIEAGTEDLPVVHASAGRVENLRALGGGRFTADWVAPAEAYPRVAVVGVLAGGRCAFVSIPLVGHGLAIARSAPRSLIRVTIGDAEFGPVVADARGEAQVPVVVPPGVRFAYHRGKPLDLRIPPSPRVAVLLGREEAPADGARDVPIFVHAVTDDGGPRAGAAILLDVTIGAVDAPIEIAPGTFAAVWHLPPGRAGSATATARVADDPAPPGTASLARPPGPPARTDVEVARRRFTAGEGAPVPLRVRVADAAGNPVAGPPLLEATLGTVSALAAAEPGAWDASLTLPASLGKARRAEVVARAGAAESHTSLELAPAEPSRLVLAPDAGTLVADGGAEARVRVQVLDRFGNDVGVPAPAVAATRGGSVAAEPDPAGGWTLRFRPVRARAPAEETLSIRAGSLAGSARFELLAPERRVVVAPTLGFAASTAALRSALFGAQAGYWTHLFSGRLGAALDVATFVHERTDTALAGGAAVEIQGRARYVPVLAALRWREGLGPLAAWGSVGAGVAAVSASVTASGAAPQRASGLAAALQASLAVGRRLGHGIPFAEVRAVRIADPGF